MIYSLEKIRGKLKRAFDTHDQHGFSYESIFGCPKDQSMNLPHVSVRVELRPRHNVLSVYQFYVFVDFCLYPGMRVPEAEMAHKAVSAAMKKARWAEKLVSGHTWSLRDDL